MKITVIAAFRKCLADPVAHNVVSLYAMQWAGYIIPVVTLPFLARVLRPQGFGLLMFSQSFALWASMLIEYGFNYSATRQVARSRHSGDDLAQIAAGVLGAKFVLLGSVLVAVVAAGLLAPAFREHPIYLICAFPQIAAGGFSPFWYFQGTERMTAAIAVEFTSRLLFTGLIFAFVHSNSDGWKVLLLTGSAGCLTTIVTTRMLYCETRFVRPDWAHTREALREGWGMFLFRSSYSLFTTSNAFILGLMTSSVRVGLYAGAERIARAVQSQIGPLTQGFYPRINHLFSKSEESGRRAARIVITVSSMAGLVLGTGLAIAAGPLTHIILGKGYESSVEVVRLFAFVLPVSALSNGLIMHWMLPQKMDSQSTRSILGAIVVNVMVAVILAPRFAQTGMGFAVLAAEIFMLAAVALQSTHRKVRQRRPEMERSSVQVKLT